MRVPTPEELAAIAAAYLVVTGTADGPAAPPVPRWRSAARMPAARTDLVRSAARVRSHWALAGRIDG
jgi:hypothetical protein